MRIVAGEFRSRTIDAVAGSATRPTADKIKEAVFSRIGPYFEGGRMLDAYAGSGNISFEAHSRGKCESWQCDISAKAVATIRSNASKLGVEEIPALGETFDPSLHNAVMHVEDENVGENTVVDVFQTGFKLGDKVIRFAMVKVAN